MGGLFRKEGDRNRTAKDKEEVVGQYEGRSREEGTARGGAVWIASYVKCG